MMLADVAVTGMGVCNDMCAPLSASLGGPTCACNDITQPSANTQKRALRLIARTHTKKPPQALAAPLLPIIVRLIAAAAHIALQRRHEFILLLHAPTRSIAALLALLPPIPLTD